MKTKTAEQMTLRLAAYYNFNGEMPDGSIHPKIKDMIDYAVKYVSQDNAKLFYDKIIANCKWMPNHKELSEIYNSLSAVNNYRIGKDEKITQKSALISFSDVNDDINYESNGNYTVQDVLEDDKKRMSNKDQLKKYGIKLCGEAWIYNTEKWNNNDWHKWEMQVKKDAGCYKVNNTTVDMRDMEYIHE